MFEQRTGLKFEEKDLSKDHPVHFHEYTYDEGAAVRLHYHNSLEINFFHSVTGTVFIEGEKLELEDLEILVLPPGIVHSYQIDGNGGSIGVWHFGLDFFRFLRRDELKEILTSLAEPLRIGSNSQEMVAVLERIAGESLLRQNGDFLLLLQLILEKTDQTRLLKGRDQFLHNVIGYLEENFRRKISLDDIAGHANMSRYHFSRVFKERSGVAFSEYLANLRLEFSMKCMDRGMSIEEAAEQAGFSDPSYFTKKFKGFYGITPGAYRKYLLRIQ